MSHEPIEWERQESGWYTSRIGGIHGEHDGSWRFYPLVPKDAAYPQYDNRTGSVALGSETFLDAMRAAELWWRSYGPGSKGLLE